MTESIGSVSGLLNLIILIASVKEMTLRSCLDSWWDEVEEEQDVGGYKHKSNGVVKGSVLLGVG